MRLLSVRALRKSFGGVVATDNLDLTLDIGEIHAVIGPNGAGKTTLFRQLSGEIMPDGGSIEFRGSDITRAPPHQRALIGIARSYQVSSLFPDFSVIESAIFAVQAISGHSFRFWRPVLDDPQLVQPAMSVLARVGLSELHDTKVSDLPHGACRQLEVALALASKPMALLLDEPMAGLSRHETVTITELIASLRAEYGILLVEHDLDAVFALADRISVLVEGRCIATGPVSEIRADRDVQMAYIGELDSAA